MENLCNNQDEDQHPRSDWNSQKSHNDQEQGFDDNHNIQNGYKDETQEFHINRKEDFKLDDELILDSSFPIDEIDSWVLDYPIQDNDNTLIPFSHEDSMMMVCNESGENMKSHDNLFSETALPLHETLIVGHQNGENTKNHDSLFPETSLPIPQTSIVHYNESNENINNHESIFSDTALPLREPSLACHENGENVKNLDNLLPKTVLPLHQTSLDDGIHDHGGDDDSSLYRTITFLKDGYKWKKYGKKERKGTNHPRCYYKCTHSKCLVKKIVEMNEDGNITLIRYRDGEHNHPMPNKEQCLPFFYQVDQYSSNSFYNRVTRGDIVVIRKKSETDNVEDKFNWRKYGEKVVKGNSNPRSYYKCTEIKCSVRRQCERSFEEPEYVIITYDGKHNHMPTPIRGKRGAFVLTGGGGGVITGGEIVSGLDPTLIGDGVYREGCS